MTVAWPLQLPSKISLLYHTRLHIHSPLLSHPRLLVPVQTKFQLGFLFFFFLNLFFFFKSRFYFFSTRSYFSRTHILFFLLFSFHSISPRFFFFKYIFCLLLNSPWSTQAILVIVPLVTSMVK